MLDVQFFFPTGLVAPKSMVSLCSSVRKPEGFRILEGGDVMDAETCLERCICNSSNCEQKEDGTWDCSSSEEVCPEICGIR